MTNKELHTILRQYRILPISVTGYLMWFNWWIADFMMNNIHDLSEWQLAPFSVIIPALVAGLFKTSQMALQKHEADD